MTQHQNKTRLRALRAVLTRAACACHGLRVILVDVICVMLVVLIGHDEVLVIYVAILL